MTRVGTVCSMPAFRPRAARGTISFLLGSTMLSVLPWVAAHAQSVTPQGVPPVQQGVAPTQPVKSNSRQLEQIVVTAQRRSEKLQKTPVTVTALSSATLAKKAVTTETDLQTATSGLLVRQGTNSNQLNYAIRGQSVDVFSQSQPGVLPYFDEVEEDAHAATAFYDLQSVQVLKGPQGTLFGRNDTGGAVLITSARPADDFSGYITTRAGNYGYIETLGAVNLPIVPDKVLLRVAGDYDHRAGYVNDVYDNTTPGTILREAGRISLLVKPNDWLQNYTVVDYNHGGGTDTPSEIYSVYQPGSRNAGIPLNSTAAEFYTPFLNNLFFPGAFNIYLAANPKANPLGIFNALAQQQAHGPDWVDAQNSYLHRSDNTLVSNITTVNLNDDLTLRNIFGFDRSDALDYTNAGGVPYELELTKQEGVNDDTTNYSEEIQLLGKAIDEQLSYVTGFYYLHSNVYGGVGLSVLGLTPFRPATNALYFYTLPDTSYAGYAQGTYDLSRLTGVKGLGLYRGASLHRRRLRLKPASGVRSLWHPRVVQPPRVVSHQAELAIWGSGASEPQPAALRGVAAQLQKWRL